MSDQSEFEKWQLDMIERAFGISPYADDTRDLAIGTMSGMDMARDWILNKAYEIYKENNFLDYDKLKDVCK